MQEASAHVGLNGSGAGYVAASTIEAVMTDPERRAALARRVMGTRESLRSIARSIDVDEKTLRLRVRAEGWTRPAGAPRAGQRGQGTPGGKRGLARTMADAEAVRERILRAIDRQVGKIEARLRKPGAALEDRDSRVLGELAKSLNTLMQTGEGGRSSKPMEPPHRDDVEDRLAERIKKWARGE